MIRLWRTWSHDYNFFFICWTWKPDPFMGRLAFRFALKQPTWVPAKMHVFQATKRSIARNQWASWNNCNGVWAGKGTGIYFDLAEVLVDVSRRRAGYFGAYTWLDCKTVGFFLQISKEIGKAWRKSLTRAKRASLTRQPRSRLFVWLLALTWIRKNTDCFAV